MKKTILIATLILILTSSILIITAKNTPSERMYTKAICNETHCQDYQIYCNNGKIENKIPITGAIIKKTNNWIDIRDNETINKEC